MPEDPLQAIRARAKTLSSTGLADAVSQGVRDGVLDPGTTLPPIRAIASELRVSPSTVSAAWAILSRAGVVHSDGRRGTFVTERVSRPDRHRRSLQFSAQFEIDLSTSLPDPDLLPDLAPALARLPLAGALQTYLDEPVIPELGDLLRESWPYAAGALTLADGVMDALDLICATFLRYGDRVAVERLTDPGILDLLEATGVRPVPVALDAEGPLPDSLSAALAAGAKTVLLQPRAQQPTGTTISPDRAERLADAIRAADARLIEVDFSGAVATSAPVSLATHIPERTLHILSYSTSHGPELRISAVSGPQDLIETLVQRRHLGQGWTSRLLQHLLFDLLTNEDSVRQVETARRKYAERRQALAAELRKHGVVAGNVDGLHLWVPVDSELSALVSLSSRGVGVAPGSPFAVETTADGHLFVNAGQMPAHLAPGVAQALADAADGRGRGNRG